jgi:CRISPR-associated protein Cas2
MSLYVAAYDVSEDRRRNKVSKVLCQYGHRVQKSVFVVQVTPDELPDLRRQVGEHLGLDDQFDLFPVDERGSRRQWRWQEPITDYEPVLVI